jgi:hypothetical protein
MGRVYRSAPEYAVRPVVGVSRGLAMPLSLERYADNVDRHFARVQAWFLDLLGVTFELEQALVWRSDWIPLTEDYWIYTMKELAGKGVIDVDSGRRFYYFVTPLIGPLGGWVGGEWIDAKSLMPGLASIPSYMGRLLGGWNDFLPNEWWADEARESMGGVAHELGHSFGAYQDAGGRWQGMPHNDSWESDSVMLEWWLFNRGAGFTEREKEMMATSPVGQKFLS